MNVSVVMAAKNYARFIREALDSVRAQTHTDWELLVIDDGSSDDTPAVVRPYLADSRVRYFRSDALGQPRAKNLGVALARGRFVAFLDADDAWEPTKLEKQLPLFDAPEVGVAFCARALMDEESRALPTQEPEPPPTGFVLPQMFAQNFVCFSSCVVRREALAHVGGFGPQWDLAIDYDFWLRVAAHYQFAHANEKLVRYRTGHGNLSKRLRDRVDTALSIMHRAEMRYAVGESVPPGVIAEGYASTCRTLGYVTRASEPREAVRWYLRALKWPGRRLLALKGIAGVVRTALHGRRAAGAPENASWNL